LKLAIVPTCRQTRHVNGRSRTNVVYMKQRKHTHDREIIQGTRHHELAGVVHAAHRLYAPFFDNTAQHTGRDARHSTRAHARAHTHTYTHTQRIYTYTHTYTHVTSHTHTHTLSLSLTHTHKHTHTHTHTTDASHTPTLELVRLSTWTVRFSHLFLYINVRT